MKLAHKQFLIWRNEITIRDNWAQSDGNSISHPVPIFFFFSCLRKKLTCNVFFSSVLLTLGTVTKASIYMCRESESPRFHCPPNTSTQVDALIKYVSFLFVNTSSSANLLPSQRPSPRMCWVNINWNRKNIINYQCNLINYMPLQQIQFQSRMVGAQRDGNLSPAMVNTWSRLHGEGWRQKEKFY